ncbi:hypothetical protein HMPREF9997_00531 [Corynebacterium durum F0235]|uniref:Uncharacterized protein n=1 Tax=Corynebacterium durum F0235 TaxID=1035195 RepID=L1MKW8_9CORY|nr:hypothetical protein HMPREF9997_00531 [Corynebacterium durum F0235]
MKAFIFAVLGASNCSDGECVSVDDGAIQTQNHVTCCLLLSQDILAEVRAEMIFVKAAISFWLD